jgi:RNA polymerase sigma factor (sigma-70 family)
MTSRRDNPSLETRHRHLLEAAGGDEALYSVALSIVVSDMRGGEGKRIAGVKQAWVAKLIYRPRAYLRRVLQNLRCQRKQRDKRLNDEATTDPAESPLEKLANAESLTALVIAVRGGLEQLSRDEREMLKLRYYSGITFQKISERMGLPLTTLHRRLGKAEEKLRELLPENLQGDS